MKKIPVKNLLIILLIVAFLASMSYSLKIKKQNKFLGFPIELLVRENHEEFTFYLVLFFSKKNCQECLRVIDILEQMPSQFVVYGVLPPNERRYEDVIRRETGATFEFIDVSAVSAYIPIYSPTLLGVSAKGRIILFLPSVPRMKEYLEELLQDIFEKAYPILVQ